MKLKLFLIFIVIITVLTLGGCKAIDYSSDIIGKWTLSMQDLDKTTAEFFGSEKNIFYEFRSDGSGTLLIFSVELPFTYSLNKNKLNMVLTDEEGKQIKERYIIKINKDKLYFSAGQYNMVFKKQKTKNPQENQ